MNEEIEKLIVKFLNRNISIEEEAVLEDWLDNPLHEQIFADYVQIHHVIHSETLNKENLKQSKERLFLNEEEQENLAVAEKSKTKVFSIEPYIKYAAALLIFGAVTTFFVLNNNEENAAVEITSEDQINIVPGSNKAILTLADGSEIALEETTHYETHEVQVSGSKITYANNATAEIEYNYLTIPRGGQYHIELADGTMVWLNSESQLKYPKNFIEGAVRQVELVYGEAYFDVSPSSKHQGASFKVLNKNQTIEVLGTEFNIKAYTDDENVLTTLVEGVVQVNKGNVKIKLKPGQQSVLDKLSKNVAVKYVDVASEVSWKDGVFSFKGKPLEEIMKTISRWYDVEVVFEDESLKDVSFKGVFRKGKSLEDILSIMKSTSINHYKIEGNIITIK
ncbi:FecR family protein [Aestuariibaculum marinum]|uniref:DUF4974 domain-containing protein n=1 Tax=Aestuariibaculum marinum TaxID=2683592 RepID=A0A8J6UD69_9FLAO|nr:FecR domain-containing protein [Aestuariibaculum marinum]MBD0825463.1 DUF4974 domain-containing protein [Aestuariibaculum marinum]